MTVTPEFGMSGTSVDRRGALDVSSSAMPALTRRYEEYCTRQVALLLEVVPREAVRPLYREARKWATEQGLHETQDPMATLRIFCRRLLPLPPFDVWLSDYEGNRVAHLRAEVGGPPLNEAVEPIKLEVRRWTHEAEPWHATLEVYQRGDAWRGFVRFQSHGAEDHSRTGEIFCEESLQDLRDRFDSFTAITMSAFLRSTLP